MRLYYLTGSQFGISNIERRRVKVSRFQDLNDPFELLSVDITNRDIRPALRAHKKLINNTKGLVCLSRGWRNPLMWRHYAEKHTGIALGFEIPDGKAVEVIYAKHPSRIWRDSETSEYQIGEEFVNRLLITKFFDWHYEEEWRVFVELQDMDPETGLYFFGFSENFQLREVILGPRCKFSIKEAKRILESSGSQARVIKSRIAFSKFQVVEDKKATARG